MSELFGANFHHNFVCDAAWFVISVRRTYPIFRAADGVSDNQGIGLVTFGQTNSATAHKILLLISTVVVLQIIVIN
jgi:hypothetical protein